MIRTAPNPLFTTEKFYSENKKSVKEKAVVSRPRFHHLEEIELRKRVFVGDSNTVFDERIYTNYDFQKYQTTKKKGI
jgi:hypothetical protein